MKRAVVTGGAGFIGSHIVDLLTESGWDVLVLDDLSSGNRDNLPPQVVLEQVDVRSKEIDAILTRFRPEVVFHLAAQIDVRRSVADVAFDAEVNVLGTIRVAQAAARAGCKQIVFSSTGGAIYGEQEVFPATEEHPCRPLSPYGAAKYCAEQYLALFQRTGGPRATCLRYANVYGPRQDPHGEAGVVAIFAGKMLASQTPHINGDGLQTRDYVYVADVARANLLAVEREAEGVFNIGTGVETDVNTLAELLAKATGYQGSIEHGKAKPGEQQRSVIDAAKALRNLGWAPAVSLAAGLDDTVRYFRDRA